MYPVSTTYVRSCTVTFRPIAAAYIRPRRSCCTRPQNTENTPFCRPGWPVAVLCYCGACAPPSEQATAGKVRDFAAHKLIRGATCSTLSRAVALAVRAVRLSFSTDEWPCFLPLDTLLPAAGHPHALLTCAPPGWQVAPPSPHSYVYARRAARRRSHCSQWSSQTSTPARRHAP